MKQNYTVNNLEFLGGGYRQAFNFVRFNDTGFPVKNQAKQSGSSLFLKTSSIQQAKRKIKTANEEQQRITEGRLKKTRENFFRPQEQMWPFSQETPSGEQEEQFSSHAVDNHENHVYHTNKNSNLEILKEETYSQEEHYENANFKYPQKRLPGQTTVQ